MPSFNIIYIIAIISVTVLIFVLYMRSVVSHNAEVDKILRYEKVIADKEKALEMKRYRTKKCPYTTDQNPRSCYFDSNYKCTWDEDAEQCVSKK